MVDVKVRSTIAVALVMLVGGLAPEASERMAPEVYTATTANMTPAGLALKIDVLSWPAESDRGAVLSVLDGAGETGLSDLPTVGYVWPEDSGVGYSLKYAHRVEDQNGGERITFVTGKRLGTFGREPWTTSGATSTDAGDFTVIELRLDGEGKGSGTMSLATGVTLDRDARTVSIEDFDAAPTLLDAVVREPEPYWARGG